MDSFWQRWQESPLWFRMLATAALGLAGVVSFTMTALLTLTAVSVASLNRGTGRWPGQGWWNQGPARQPASIRRSQTPSHYR